MRASRRAEHLKYKYGVTEDDYNTMLENQDGRCAICGTTDPGSQSAYFHIDHDHECCPSRYTCGQCIRGLLCQPCNQAIGKFKDDAQALRAAAAYITRNKRKRIRTCLKSKDSTPPSETLEELTLALPSKPRRGKSVSSSATHSAEAVLP